MDDLTQTLSLVLEFQILLLVWNLWYFEAVVAAKTLFDANLLLQVLLLVDKVIVANYYLGDSLDLLKFSLLNIDEGVDDRS